MRRTLLALTLGVGLGIGTIGSVAAQQEPPAFTVNGTVISLDSREPNFITSDISGQEQVIRVDFSRLEDLDSGRVANLESPESIQIVLQNNGDGTYLAVQYAELAKGSKVNNQDWGNLEANTTRDDSIEARVDNVPDDDEARAQGDKFDNKGRRQKEDDD